MCPFLTDTGPVAHIRRWTKEDHEIFDLVSALEAAEGKPSCIYGRYGWILTDGCQARESTSIPTWVSSRRLRLPTSPRRTASGPSSCSALYLRDKMCIPDVFSPDKNPGVKGIEDRFARLGVINQILRSPEGRERYNVSRLGRAHKDIARLIQRPVLLQERRSEVARYRVLLLPIPPDALAHTAVPCPAHGRRAPTRHAAQLQPRQAAYSVL